MRRVPISEVKDGDILATEVLDLKGRVLLKKGNVLDDYFISKIEEHHVQSVYITDHVDDIETLKDVVSPLVRLKAIDAVRKLYIEFVAQTTVESMYAGSKDYLNENPHILKIMLAADELTDEIFMNPKARIEMVNIKSKHGYMYEHAVSVAVLSLLLGMDLNLKEQELGILVLASLLMDIGNGYVDSDILEKNIPLSDEEIENIRQHPKLSYDFLTHKTQLNPITRHIILQHHERLDGSGYPNGIKDKEIHPLTRIIAITDTYDALTSDRPYRPGYSPNEALEMIMSNAGTLFDFEYAQLFARRVVAFPTGTFVLLSNGDQGEVIDENINIPLRPIIRIKKHKLPDSKYEVLDLKAHLNITIEKVIYQIK